MLEPPTTILLPSNKVSSLPFVVSGFICHLQIVILFWRNSNRWMQIIDQRQTLVGEQFWWNEPTTLIGWNANSSFSAHKTDLTLNSRSGVDFVDRFYFPSNFLFRDKQSWTAAWFSQINYRKSFPKRKIDEFAWFFLFIENNFIHTASKKKRKKKYKNT